MTNVDPIATGAAVTGTTGATGTSGTTGGMWTSGVGEAPPAPNEMGKDAFLKLLVAQLKYQDPLNPAEGAEFMAQTAQFTMVERLEELKQTNIEMLAGQQTLAGSSLLGRQITYLDQESGADVTGEVAGVRFEDGSVLLIVGDTEVPLASVKEVTREQVVT